MEEKYSGSENFGPSHYDYNFDFDFVLQFSAFEYFLIGLYLVFVVPFILVSEQIFNFFQQHKKKGRTPGEGNRRFGLRPTRGL
jgi:hypothetical protein